MYFPAADITANPLLLPIVAFIVSFFCSMGGISGAFLLLPFQVSYLGYVNPSVSATNQFYNVVAIPSGVYRYVREKRMVWPLALVIAIGTLPGVVFGALIRIVYLPDPKVFKLFAGCVLAYIGCKLLADLLRLRRKGEKAAAQCTHKTQGSNSGVAPAQQPEWPNKNMHCTASAGQTLPNTDNPAHTAGLAGQTVLQHAAHTTEEQKHGGRFSSPAHGGFVTDVNTSLKAITYGYQGEQYRCPLVPLFLLSLVIGLVGGCYGIGGGAIMAPILVSWYRLPVHTLGGATLLGTFLTSLAGIAFYHYVAPYFPGQSVAPDWMLGFLLGMGGFTGMYLGARCQKFVPAGRIKWMLCIVILATAMQYIIGYFK